MNLGVFVVGLVILIAGVLASGYTITGNGVAFFASEAGSQPYDYLAIPLIVIGLLLMVISAIIPSVTETTERKTIEHPVQTKKTTTVRED